MSTSTSPVRSVVVNLVRRPAVMGAILFMLGIALHRILPHRADVWLVMGVLLLLGTVVMFREATVSTICLLFATPFAGIAAAQIQAFHYPNNHIGAFATDIRRLAHVEMTIDEPPRILTGVFGQFRALPPKQVLTGSVVRLKTWNGWIDVQGDMLVQIAQPHPRLASGQRIRALGMLERPGPAMNPGQFDWARYYREQRILVSMQIARAQNVQILEQSQPTLRQRLRRSTRQLLACGFETSRSLDHALLRALLVGDRDPEMRDVQEQFRRTGTSHHLAISGMHVAVLGGVVYGVCRVLRLGPAVSVWIGMFFVALYGTAALPSPPVVRSVLLCLAFGLGILARRAVDGVQLLALTVLAMLVYHPLDVFNAGFQLSFLTVLGLILMTDLLANLMMSQAARDRIIAMLARPPDRLTALSAWTDQKVLKLFSGAMIAWLVSFPLVATHFEQLNPWGVAGSIFMAPFVFASLIAGMLKVIFTLLWPSLAGTWASFAAEPVAAMRWAVDLLATLPASDVPLPAPPLLLVGSFYLVLLMMLRPGRLPGTRWTLGFTMLFLGLSMVALPYHTRGPVRPATDELRVTLLAVGGGQCAVVEPPSGRVLVIDAGSLSLSDLLRKCVGPFLRHRARTSIDTIVISHANYDHFSAAAEIVAAYDVREVLTGAAFRFHSIDNPPAEGLLRALDQQDRPPRVIMPGDVIPLGRDTTLEVLWPGKSSKGFAANDASLVVKLTHAGRSILFPGDVQEPALRELLKNRDRLGADLLIAPHHGSGEASTVEFVRAVNPSYVLSSNDRTLTMKQRDFEQMIGSAKLYRTHRHGAITIRIDGQGNLTVEPFLPGE